MEQPGKLPLRKILCPTDFSEFSRDALIKAGELAAHFGAQLCPLHVTQPIPPSVGLAPYPIAPVDIARYEKSAAEDAEREMKAITQRPEMENVDVLPLVRIGQPTEEIIKAARLENVDLIVIATHGLTGWRRHTFGSVTERVLRLSPCPVLMLRAENVLARPALPLSRILTSTDFSEPSYAALDVAGDWARHFEAALNVVHVVEPLEHSGLVLGRSDIEEAMQADAVRRLRNVIEGRLPKIADSGVSIRPRVAMGKAAETIAALADREDADLIVLATHGAGVWRAMLSGTSIGRWLFGSVTTNVMRLSTRPILTVRMAEPQSV